MKIAHLLILTVLLILSKQEISYNSTITFSNNEVSSSGEGVEISGTNVTINKEGSFLATGTSTEGTITISAKSVELYLQNLNLASSLTSPIIVDKKLTGVKIISIENVVLNDLEDPTTTTGECAVIKVKKNSQVTFSNQNDFTLNGNCKNVIKGGAKSSIIFDSSNGVYTVNAYQNGISSDDYLKFNGGKFVVTTKTGDAIKSSPDDTDTESLGKIFVNGGTFEIESYSDGFQAKNNIIIKKGTFNIKTENGYTSSTFDKDTGSAKGFKVSNNSTGCYIKVYDGEFSLNTADDAFHSNGNLTLIDGNYLIYAGDDGLHAEFHLLIGKSDSSTTPNINILNSYEAIEGMSIRIYSGKINATATDDGMNAAGGSSSSDVAPGPGPGPGPRSNLAEGPTPGGGGSGNASYFISIYGGEINVFCDGDGLDSNGNIFIHGGDINIFSQGNQDNEPIDHEANFTLFNANVLCVGAKGMEYVHSGLLKGNQAYVYYSQSISKGKTLTIKNGDGNIIKTANITKDINYIFYSSPDLNSNYEFYIDGTKYDFNLGNSPTGEDDQDQRTDDGGQSNDDGEPTEKDGGEESSDDEKGSEDSQSKENNGEGDNSSSISTFIICISSIVVAILIIVLIIFLYKKFHKPKDAQAIMKDINKEMEMKEE